MAFSLIDKFRKKEQVQGEVDTLTNKEQEIEKQLDETENELQENPDSQSLVDKYKSTEQDLEKTHASLEGGKTELDGLISEEDKAKFAKLQVTGQEATQEEIATDYESFEKETNNRVTQLDQNVYLEENTGESNPADTLSDDIKRSAVDTAKVGVEPVEEMPNNPVDQAKSAAQQTQDKSNEVEQDGPEYDDD